MKIIPFEPGHIWQVRLQSVQVVALGEVTPQYAQLLAASGPAVSAIEDGILLGCCGVAATPYTGGILWGFVGTDCGPRMLKVHRGVSRFIDSVRHRRIEATVLAGFEPGCRWMKLLGFEFEGVMRKYGSDGSDYLRYAKVR